MLDTGSQAELLISVGPCKSVQYYIDPRWLEGLQFCLKTHALPFRIHHSPQGFQQPMKKHYGHYLHCASLSYLDSVRQQPIFITSCWRPPSTCCLQQAPKETAANLQILGNRTVSRTGGRGCSTEDRWTNNHADRQQHH